MFFVNINYFHQFSGIFCISLLQTNQRHQHVTDDLSIFFFFSLQPTLNWLFINCIKLFWIWISASWNIKRRSNRVKSGVFFFWQDSQPKLPVKIRLLLQFILMTFNEIYENTLKLHFSIDSNLFTLYVNFNLHNTSGNCFYFSNIYQKIIFKEIYTFWIT